MGSNVWKNKIKVNYITHVFYKELTLMFNPAEKRTTKVWLLYLCTTEHVLLFIKIHKFCPRSKAWGPGSASDWLEKRSLKTGNFPLGKITSQNEQLCFLWQDQHITKLQQHTVDYIAVVGSIEKEHAYCNAGYIIQSNSPTKLCVLSSQRLWNCIDYIVYNCIVLYTVTLSYNCIWEIQAVHINGT